MSRFGHMRMCSGMVKKQKNDIVFKKCLLSIVSKFTSINYYIQAKNSSTDPSPLAARHVGRRLKFSLDPSHSLRITAAML